MKRKERSCGGLPEIEAQRRYSEQDKVLLTFRGQNIGSPPHPPPPDHEGG